MVDLQRLSNIRNFLIGVRDDPTENATVRAKAQEVIALFDPPSLAQMQALFNGGSNAEKLAALGSLQSAMIRGRLDA